MTSGAERMLMAYCRDLGSGSAESRPSMPDRSGRFCARGIPHAYDGTCGPGIDRGLRAWPGGSAANPAARRSRAASTGLRRRRRRRVPAPSGPQRADPADGQDEDRVEHGVEQVVQHVQDEDDGQHRHRRRQRVRPRRQRDALPGQERGQQDRRRWPRSGRAGRTCPGDDPHAVGGASSLKNSNVLLGVRVRTCRRCARRATGRRSGTGSTCPSRTRGRARQSGPWPRCRS